MIEVPRSGVVRTSAGISGDGNLNGDVEAANYTLWANNFGMMVVAPESAAAVPEPSTLVLLLIGAVGLIAARRLSKL